MRLHRFYISTLVSSSSALGASKTLEVTDRDLIHQWRNVFRYNVGSQVILFDGSGIDYLCMISSLRNLGATVSVLRETKITKKIGRMIWLCQALIKKDNFEMVTQKVVEIGVSVIVPILAERSEKKKVNMERLKKIAVEASEQSGRADVPEIFEETTLVDLFESGALPPDKIALDLTGIDFHKFVSGLNPVGAIAVFVGPEGGWSEKEIEFFKQHNVSILSLGSQILRAETASIAISSLLLLSK